MFESDLENIWILSSYGKNYTEYHIPDSINKLKKLRSLVI